MLRVGNRLGQFHPAGVLDIASADDAQRPAQRPRSYPGCRQPSSLNEDGRIPVLLFILVAQSFQRKTELMNRFEDVDSDAVKGRARLLGIDTLAAAKARALAAQGAIAERKREVITVDESLSLDGERSFLRNLLARRMNDDAP